MFLIGDYSQRRAGAETSKIQQFLRDEPTQFDARNALLSHLGARDTLRHFLVFSPSRSVGGWLLCLARLVTFMTFGLSGRARVNSPAPASIVPSASGDCADNYHEEK